jgi:hypothetical protein
MTFELFSSWITKWDKDLAVQKRHILLLVDNFSGHGEPPEYKLTNIRLEFFAPNLTSHIQPLDAGIIATFKCYYRSNFINYSLQRYDSEVPIAEIYKINQLDAMKLAQDAWFSVTESTISNCFHKTGIISPRNLDGSVKDNPTCLQSDFNMNLSKVLDSEAKALLAEDLDQLEQLNLVNQRNQMSIAELLNPQGEHSSGLEQWTVEEIFESIIQRDTKEDHDTTSDIIEVSPPRPSYSAFKHSLSVVSEYVKYEDTPEAKSFGAAIRAATRHFRVVHTRSLKQASVSDFFKKK